MGTIRSQITKTIKWVLAQSKFGLDAWLLFASLSATKRSANLATGQRATGG
jgi:hypothetical protein